MLPRFCHEGNPPERKPDRRRAKKEEPHHEKNKRLLYAWLAGAAIPALAFGASACPRKRQRRYKLETGEEAVLIRTRHQVVVTLRAAQTGAVLATSESIDGELPRECPPSEKFEAGQLTKYTAGARPFDALAEWLKPFAEEP